MKDKNVVLSIRIPATLKQELIDRAQMIGIGLSESVQQILIHKEDQLRQHNERLTVLDQKNEELDTKAKLIEQLSTELKELQLEASDIELENEKLTQSNKSADNRVKELESLLEKHKINPVKHAKNAATVIFPGYFDDLF